MYRWLAAGLLLVVLASRLLMSATGAGNFAPPATVPPFDDSWSRSGANPILSPAVAWEETAVYEPIVMHQGSSWKMWYGGGWDHPALGHATSSDGISWTKYGSNPVYGQGGSSYAYTSASGEVLLVDGTYWLFTSGGTSTTDARSTFRVATSADGIAWTTQSSSISLPSGKTLWGNRTVIVEGSSWTMLQEAGASPWAIYLYSSTDGLTWTIGNGGAALSSLQVAVGGMYGGPEFARNAEGTQTARIGGVYHLWYHAAPVSGNLPTNIYHATSTDLVSWTISPAGPVLTYAGSGFEVDQVADPCVVVVNETAYLFYDGDDNVNEAADIGVATAPATH